MLILSKENVSFKLKSTDRETSNVMADPFYNFNKQFNKFVNSNPNVLSAAKSASQIPESAKAVIVLSPMSLQHKFPRYWVSKSYKKTIVERPERVLACSMGIAAAITMYPALYSLKTSHEREASLLSPHVLKVHGDSWPRELLRLCRASKDNIQKKHIEVPEDWNADDIYLCEETIKALQGSLGAVEYGVDSIFKGSDKGTLPNRAFVAIRPPGHHSHVATPSGFCLLNNSHIAVEYAAATYGVTHAAILDFDLHHGDGTQDICWKRAGFKPDDIFDDTTEYNEFGKKFAEYPKVGYFSVHDINSFPTELGYATKENIKDASTCIMDSHDVNIWNVHLMPYENEEEFNKLYQTKYRTLFAKADEFLKNARRSMAKKGGRFKGLIVISAGFDASEYEQSSMQRHGVNVPTSFFATFTKDVLKLAQMHTAGKVLSLLEGGYSDGAISSGVFAHLIGLQNQQWINEWGSEQVIKEITRGCKANWKPYKTKRSRDVIRTWAEEVIKLGRSLISDFDEDFFNEDPTETKTRVTRSNKQPELVATIDQKTPLSRSQTPTPTGKSTSNSASGSDAIPFIDQNFSGPENDDDEDYVYDEELNKTFNRTVEDITIDDISRHLETLEIAHPQGQPHETINHHEDKIHESKLNPATQGGYRVPSTRTTRHLRNSRNSRVLSIDDSDVSMISRVSPEKQRSSRSERNKW
ncbi:HCL527Wp [Eremothecium sinecaudum]|uniref:HCL527Wp n=1 Tax=Eremothecium sinecaudum TaxID=45286 RepID=A0A120K1Q2_9SACH|nr:HCL527Wp [Eremothecium sinecaudum]AMD19624.1 HCL527Wp [Eremothecium sinecaudum]